MGWLSNISKSIEDGKIQAQREASAEAQRNAEWKATVERNERQWGNAADQARREGDKEAADWYQKRADHWNNTKR